MFVDKQVGPAKEGDSRKKITYALIIGTVK